MELLRERNVAVTISFPMIKAGSQDFATSGDWTPASGDCKYSVDSGAWSNTNSLPTYDDMGQWELALLNTEINGKETRIAIIDSATKAVEDQTIMILTWGDDSAGLPLNAIADHVLRRSTASAAASSRGDSVIFRSMMGAIRKLHNRVGPSGSDLVIYAEDDTTPAGSQAMTTSESADLVTELNTN